MGFVRVPVALVLAILCSSATQAALSVYMPHETVADQAALIVEGSVAAVASGYDPGTDTLLIRGQPATSGVTMRTSWSWNRNLEFNPDGSTNEGGAIAFMSLCDNRGSDNGRQIQVALSGAPRMLSGNIDCTP